MLRVVCFVLRVVCLYIKQRNDAHQMTETSTSLFCPSSHVIVVVPVYLVEPGASKLARAWAERLIKLEITPQVADFAGPP